MGRKAAHEDIHQFWEGRWKKGETPWDHGSHAPPFEEFVERVGVPSGNVLIPGPGSGHDVYYFAKLGAKVTGLDIAPSAIKAARKLNPHRRATYKRGNFLDPAPTLKKSFDWIIEHTCLCALEPKHWPDYARSVRKLLKPGGYYLALFYRDPEDDEGPPFRIEEEEIEELFSKGLTLLQAWKPSKAYESRFGREEIRWFRRNK
ncbi:MAG: methyltransferase domain-containing protein [Puniceicoccaceae bacterium]